MWLNSGSIRNRGLEIAVDATPISIGDFEWNISGQISWNRNTIVNLGASGGGGPLYLSPDDKEPTQSLYYVGANVGQSNHINDYANIFIQGYPVGLFYGYKTEGIVKEGETGLPLTDGGAERDPGNIQYRDMNGNGYLDPLDRTVIGDPNPDFIYGFSTSFTWKDLSISASFNGSYGNELLNANLAQQTDTRVQSNPRNVWNIRREAFFDAWTPDNQDTFYPAIGTGDISETRYMNDRRIEDASFLRLSNVSISYRLPIPKNKVVNNISVGLSGSNLYVWTKYSGWDPEVSSHGNSMTKVGIDIGSYPGARTYSFDLKFTF